MNAVILQILDEITQIAVSNKSIFKPNETVNEEYTDSFSGAPDVDPGGENEMPSHEEPLLYDDTLDDHVNSCDDVSEKSGTSEKIILYKKVIFKPSIYRK